MTITATQKTVLWSVQPTTFAVRIGVHNAPDVAGKIRGMGASVADPIERVEERARTDHLEFPTYGEITLIIRASSEHDAKRTAVKVLTKLGIVIEVDNT